MSRLFTTRAAAVPGGSACSTGDDFSPGDRRAPSVRALGRAGRRASPPSASTTPCCWAGRQDRRAVKDGEPQHFFVIGGCDGAERGRNYFSEFAEATPPDSLILTLGCGKYRIRDNDYGTIELDGVGPVPRLLDMGQCNDAYGAIQVAVALAGRLRVRRQRPAADHRVVVVRAEGGGRAADAAGPGRQGHHASARRRRRSSSPNVFKILQDKYDLKLTSDKDPLADLRVAVGA